MNIFVLDSSPKIAAKYHNDFHVRKMILETAQILSTALRINGAEDLNLYNRTHIHHPCVIACTKSKDMFLWALELGLELTNEYIYRFEKSHKSSKVIDMIYIRDFSSWIPSGSVDFPLAMPETYKCSDVVKSYRSYYAAEKRFMKNGKKMDVYTKREIPEFMLTTNS
jgi:hypothetical protein